MLSCSSLSKSRKKEFGRVNEVLVQLQCGLANVQIRAMLPCLLLLLLNGEGADGS